MEFIYTIMFIDLCIIIHETLNYVVSFKEQDFRTYFVATVPLNINAVCSIALSTDTLYLVFMRALLELFGITDSFIMSLLIGLVETVSVYYIFGFTVPKFQCLSTINRFMFDVLIFRQLLRFNIIYAVIVHCHIIYMCSVIRSNYYYADNYVKPILTKFTECQEIKQTRENIYAK